MCRGALTACSRLHQPDKAAWIIEKMRERGPPPDETCYATAIDTCARKGRWSVAVSLLSTMRHTDGLAVETPTFAVVMAACHRAGQTERVLALLTEMEEAGTGGGNRGGAYATAVHSTLASREYGEMLRVLERMIAQGLDVEERLIHLVMGDLVREGRWQEAKAMLDLARRAGKLTADIYVKAVEACVPEGQWAEAFRHLETMHQEGFLRHVRVPLDGATASTMTLSSSPPSGPAALSSSRPYSSPGLDTTAPGTLANYGSGGAGASSSGSLSSSNGLPHHGGAGSTGSIPLPMEASEAAFRGAMSACRQAGDIERVFSLLDLRDSLLDKDLADYGHGPDPGRRQERRTPSMELYTLAFATCFEQERWDALPILLKHMAGHGRRPESVFFDELVRVLATSPTRRPSQTLASQISALRRLPLSQAQEGGTGVSVPCSSTLLLVFNTAIHACAAGGDWRLALDLLHELKGEKLRPDYYSFQAAIAACQRVGEWEQVLSLLQEMEASGYPPTLASYEAVMNACLRAQDWPRVVEILEGMKQVGVSPDAHFIEWILKALANRGQWRQSLEVVESLKGDRKKGGKEGGKEGGLLNNVVYNLAIKACDAGGEWKAAVKLVEDMRVKEGIRPDLYSFNTAVSACQKAGQVVQITRLLGRMEILQIRPNTYTFIMATATCLQTAAFDKLFEVFAAMERCGLDPDERFFRVLLQKFEGEGRWKESIHLLHVIRRAGRASQVRSFGTGQGGSRA